MLQGSFAEIHYERSSAVNKTITETVKQEVKPKSIVTLLPLSYVLSLRTTFSLRLSASCCRGCLRRAQSHVCFSSFSPASLLSHSPLALTHSLTHSFRSTLLHHRNIWTYIHTDLTAYSHSFLRVFVQNATKHLLSDSNAPTLVIKWR